MRPAAGLHALALVLATSSLLCNGPFLGMWYDRVGHIFINTRLWAAVSVLGMWNAMSCAYFLFALSARFRRLSAQADIVTLGLLIVFGFSAASASTAAGYLELAQCASYNRECAMGTAGGVLNWVTAAYLLGLLSFKVRHAVSWPEDEYEYEAVADQETNTGRLPVIPEAPESPLAVDEKAPSFSHV